MEFSNLQDKEELKLDNNAYEFRTVSNGINFEGFCTNEKCIAFNSNSRVIS